MESANGRLVFTCACERRPLRNIGGTGLPTRPFPWRCRMVRHVSSPRERSSRPPLPCRTDRMPSGAAALTQRGTGGPGADPAAGKKAVGLAPSLSQRARDPIGTQSWDIAQLAPQARNWPAPRRERKYSLLTVEQWSSICSFSEPMSSVPINRGWMFSLRFTEI